MTKPVLSLELAQTARIAAVRMTAKANASHIGSCLSVADILAVLYTDILRVDPHMRDSPDRDRLLLSKGHAAAVLYATLAQRGFFPVGELENFCRDGSSLTGHVNYLVPGVEFSTGSLGHALPVGCGLALAGRREQKPYRVFVLLSDGELDEGSNWESILFAPHHSLDNLVAVVDYNKIQSLGNVRDVLDLEPLADKWRSFRWSVRVVNGHDHAEIADTLSAVPFEPGRPSAVIAHTIKGKGVSYMENQLAYHYKPATGPGLTAAVRELEGTE